MGTRKLLFELLRAYSESEVTQILNKYNLDNYDDNNWKPYGGINNNYGTVGGQQSDSLGALVEKIVNSIDAVLILECLKKGINPESNQAPKDMNLASQEFFNIKEGKLSKISLEERRQLAENIRIYVSGMKPPNYPCITVVDKGEGQDPSDFHKTFLSLHEDNKIRIPFVQGKFNMGGTGVLPYCGDLHNYQLIVSRRFPSFSKENSWGFTLVRRRPPSKQEKCSRYEYFAPDNKILTLDVEKIPLSVLNNNYRFNFSTLDSFSFNDNRKIIVDSEILEWGTIIKLYEYLIKERTLATTDFYRGLNRRLFTMVLPAKILELREYSGHSLETILSGMDIRLEEDKAEVLEEGFPSGLNFNLPDIGEAKVTLALFKRSKETERWIRAKEAVFFTVNGQAHAFLSRDFFSRGSVNLRWLAQDLMIQVDCSSFSHELIERLFMTSRDTMRERPEQQKIESELASFLKHHSGLREWNEKRHREILENKVKESEHTARLLEQLIQENSEVASLLNIGTRIPDPFRHGVKKEKFIGKRFPTYLKLKNGSEITFIKLCPINSYCRVELETDASNDYLIRAYEPGSLEIEPDSISRGASLWNGILTLTLKPERNREINEEVFVKVRLSTPESITGYLEEKFIFKIQEPQPKRKSKEGKKRKTSKKLSLPKIHEVRMDSWVDFGWEEDDVAEIIEENENAESFVNMDNPSLKRFIYKDTTAKEIIEEQFKVSSTILALALKVAENNNKIKKEDSRTAIKEIGKVILPVINTLSKLAA